MKRCPKCNKAYSDIMDHCPDCNISLQDNAHDSTGDNADSKQPQSLKNNAISNQYQQQNGGSNYAQSQQNQKVQSDQGYQSFEKVVCTKCGTLNDAKSKYCGKCGSSIEKSQIVQNNLRKSSDINSNMTPRSTQKTFCGYCGIPIENASFCPSCGAKVGKKDDGFAATAKKIKKSGSKKKLFIGIGIGVVVIILAIVAILLLTSDPQDKIVGEWEYESGGRLARETDNLWGISIYGVQYIPLKSDRIEPLRITFYEDGSCKVVSDNVELDGKYEIVQDGSKLSFSGDIVDESRKAFSENEFKIEGDEMYFKFAPESTVGTDDELKVTLVKK